MPKPAPNTVPKAVWAEFALPMYHNSAHIAVSQHAVGVYMVEIITRELRVSTTKVSMNTPIMATQP